VKERRKVAILLNIAWVAHYASLVAHLVYWQYKATQTMPGMLAANLPFIVSIITPIWGGVIQGTAETCVIKANPKRFPPSPNEYVKKAWVKYREDVKDKPEKHKLDFCFCGFIPFVKAELATMKEDAAEYSERTGMQTASMTGIVKPMASGRLSETSMPISSTTVSTTAASAEAPAMEIANVQVKVDQ